MKRILIPVLSLFFCQTVSAQDFETATQAVANMGLGWNLGNSLECNSGDISNMWIEQWTSRKPSDYEKAWGQPVTKPELIALFKDAGFGAIRVPVTWYPHMEATFSNFPWDPVSDPIGTHIQAAWMQRVHEVVDYVISQGMYCIINVHHDTGTSNTHWIVADEDNYAQEHERFEAVWKQIANEFKDYDEHLLFEGYNEMLDSYNSWCFASFGTSSKYDADVAASAYSAVNKYAQSFVDAVRSTGGNNAQRNLIVNTYCACAGEGTWNAHLQDPLKEMTLPTDNVSDHLIFEVHDYPSIKSGINSAKSTIDQLMKAVETHLASKGAPVIFDEWGVPDDEKEDDYTNRNADMREFVRYFVEQAKARGFGTFYWMGLSDGDSRSVPEFSQADLVEALVKGYYGDDNPSAISMAESKSPSPSAYYDLQGYHRQQPVKGLNIVRLNDGNIKKIAR